LRINFNKKEEAYLLLQTARGLYSDAGIGSDDERIFQIDKLIGVFY